MAQPQSLTIREEELPTLLFTAGKNFAQKHYMLSGSWMIGLLICFFARGFTPDIEVVAQYEDRLGSLNFGGLLAAEDSMWRAESEYRQTKGWFSCDQICTYNYKAYREREAEFYRLKTEYEQGLSDAKSELGLTSTYAEQETRNLFWEKFARGKSFAKRTTMWDAMFFGIQAMGRDENLVSFILRLVLQLLINFTIGLAGALVAFWWSLWSVISSYQPDFLTGLMYFVVAGLAAWSFVATWLIGLYLGTASTVYVAAKVLTSQARLQGPGGQYARPGGIQYQQQARPGAQFGAQFGGGGYRQGNRYD